MHFNQSIKRQNPKFDTQVANKEKALKIIAHIDQYLEYADDTTEYEEVKKYVQTFEPTEYETVTLTDESQQLLQSELDELRQLAESLK